MRHPIGQRRKSIRLRDYDYSTAGRYFITICTDGRDCLFGEIMFPGQKAENFLKRAENFLPLQPRMALNDAGKAANDCWLQIPNHFPNVILHEHIIMPNHVHGIIEITIQDEDVGAENLLPDSRQRHQFQKMIPRSVSSIVKGY